MANTEETETAAAIQSKYEEPNVGEVDARAVQQPERSPLAATTLVRFPIVLVSKPFFSLQSKGKEPNVAKENANSKVENPAVATEQVKHVEPNLAQNEKITVDAGDIKEKTGGAAGGENKAVEITGLEKIQREWTCALCHVTTTCEKNLDTHLKGRKDRAKCQELKASKRTKPRVPPLWQPVQSQSNPLTLIDRKTTEPRNNSLRCK
ncbi:hypothetical protein Vadar_020328 [Vaccinium darrowii]|uniref:Uncharacterized protein n=1 Tax=Vaccinium darrowii TaxID=229202 RepID=A0ACB7X2Z3_9ERIC|nr:hypothetical protein Vadar_020328 [Vaccinium darrowii]